MLSSADRTLCVSVMWRMFCIADQRLHGSAAAIGIRLLCSDAITLKAHRTTTFIITIMYCLCKYYLNEFNISCIHLYCFSQFRSTKIQNRLIASINLLLLENGWLLALTYLVLLLCFLLEAMQTILQPHF